MSGVSFEPQQALTPKQVAELEQLSSDAIYRAIASGDLVARRVCRRLRVDPADYEAWKDRHRVAPTASGPMLSQITAPSPAVSSAPSARGRSRGRFLEELDAIEGRTVRGA